MNSGDFKNILREKLQTLKDSNEENIDLEIIDSDT